MRAWWRRLQSWRRTAYTGSTLAEIDTDTGELVSVPGFYPPRERWLLWRMLATWRARRRG